MDEANRERQARNIVVGMMTLEGMQVMEMTDKTVISDLNSDWVQPALDAYDKYGIGIYLTYHTKYWEKYGFELPHNGQTIEEWKQKHPGAPKVTEELAELIEEEPEEEVKTSNNLYNLYGLKGQEAQTKVKYKLFVTSEGEHNYVEISKKILMWFDRLTCEGVETYSTWKYWYLNSALDGNDVRAIMNTDKSKVEVLPSLNYSMIVKYSNGKSREVFFGYNIYDNRLEIFDLTAKPATVEQKKQANTSKSNTSSQGGGSSGGGGNPVIPPDDGEDPEPVTAKDDGDGSVQQGQAQQGGGEGRGGTGAPTEDKSKTDMQDAGGGQDQNQGHSDPETVTPGTPDSKTHTDNEGGEDDGDTSTVENTNEEEMNYGDNDGAENNATVDTGSGSSETSEGADVGEFSEPAID